MSVAGEFELRAIVDSPIIDLPPERRRFGLYRWKTARYRTTKWHLIDTDRQIGEFVRAYDGRAALPSLHPPIPMLCGVRSRGPVETLIRTWEDLCMFDFEPLKPDERGVCGACILHAVKGLLGGTE